jgi:hypothetical protein
MSTLKLYPVLSAGAVVTAIGGALTALVAGHYVSTTTEADILGILSALVPVFSYFVHQRVTPVVQPRLTVAIPLVPAPPELLTPVPVPSAAPPAAADVPVSAPPVAEPPSPPSAGLPPAQ